MGEIKFRDDSKLSVATAPIKFPTYYPLDVDKLNTIEDIKLVLKHLNIHLNDTHEDFDKVKHLAKITKE